MNGFTETDFVLEYPSVSLTNVVPGVLARVEEMVDICLNEISLPMKKFWYAKERKMLITQYSNKLWMKRGQNKHSSG